MKIKFSIITAVYNRSSTIGQAIESVAAQSYDNIEHLVIDGASTDETLVEVQKHSHARIRVVSEPDKGIYHALNKGMAMSTGDVIGLMHSDDFFAHKDVLSNVARVFEAEQADAVYGDLDYISATDPSKVLRRWKPGDFSHAKLSRGWMPPHPSLYVRRNVIERFGGYNTNYSISADYEAILRWFGSGGIKSVYLPEIMVKMRIGGESNRSLERVIQKSFEDYRALRSTKMGGLVALSLKNLSKIPQFLGK
ncbi:glycosyltransferase family 2 protein [Lentibacter algarum]|uniref:glycosyltransferase family 2 protein n=1 Tax=Lentibacter algarum TaxID=576131 RepID=UPI00339D54FD